MAAEHDDALLDYDESAEAAVATGGAEAEGEKAEGKKGHYVGVHSSGFRDFMLDSKLLQAVVDCGFEHPSEVQHEAIPQALLGMDVLCQAKSGMGKTAVFVLSTLNNLKPVEGEVSVLVLCHTRELAFQIGAEYQRFSRHMPSVKAAVLYGGTPRQEHVKMLAEHKPNIVIGTPGRVKDLMSDGTLKLDKVKTFVLDECDKMLETLDMRKTVQEIFVKTPHDKQVMMFSATMPKEIKPVCLKFMHDPMEIYVENDTKLTLHGLQQFYCKLKPEEKNRQLADLLDGIDFNQAVIFVSKVERAQELDRLLRENGFPSMHIHSRMKQEERLKRYEAFRSKDNPSARILVTTNLMGRGIDIEKVNMVVNYDFPSNGDKSNEPAADQYLHRVGRAGRFGTKGLAVSFVSSEEDDKALQQVQERFAVSIPALPPVADVDPKLYKS